MKFEVLDLICCPNCKSDLVIDGEFLNGEYIQNGRCKCLACISVFPIINDIIYFAKADNSSGSSTQKKVYSYWWNESHKNLVYDDVGCGNGRFSTHIANKNPKLLVLFDISNGIEKAYKDALKITKNVIAIQGDILNLPFKYNVFNNVYSWGVLHHTGKTREAFNQTSLLVKNNGKFGVYLYEDHPVYSYDNIGMRLLSIIRELFIIRPLRFTTQLFPPKIVIGIFYPIFLLERFLNFGIIGCHGVGKEKFEKTRYFRAVIDRFKSKYATEHSVDEVIKWFIDQNYNNIEVGEGVKVSLTGTKKEAKLSKVSVIINL